VARRPGVTAGIEEPVAAEGAVAAPVAGVIHPRARPHEITEEIAAEAAAGIAGAALAEMVIPLPHMEMHMVIAAGARADLPIPLHAVGPRAMATTVAAAPAESCVVPAVIEIADGPTTAGPEVVVGAASRAVMRMKSRWICLAASWVA